MAPFSYILDKDSHILHWVLKILYAALPERFCITGSVDISILQSQLFKRQLTSLFWPG